MKLHDHLTFGENETGVEINRWKPASWEFGDSSRGHGKDINGSGVALK